jgi:Polysaccharide lyase
MLLPGCLLALVAGQSRQLIDVYDGFESPTLSKVWSAEKSLPGAIEIQPEVVRSGRSAALITLHAGDQLDDEKGTVLERAELMEARELTSREDSAYEYSFSLFLPHDFPIVPTRLVIAQWKQYCPSGQCDPNNPVLALRYQGGEFRVTLHAGAKTRTLFRTKDEIRGKWLDFTFLIRFSRGDKGRVKASLNGRQIADYTGATAYSEAFGYPPSGRFYFKMGLYRDRMVETMKIYADEYRKRELLKEGF